MINKKEKLKDIYNYLKECGCTSIEFYLPQDVKFEAKNSMRVIREIYKISFMNKNFKVFNFFLTFNTNNILYRAENTTNASWCITLDDKSSQEVERILDVYLNKDSVMGLSKMEQPIQSTPIRFLDTLDPNQFNIYVEILKYKNITKQSCKITDYMFFDEFDVFFKEFLPIFTQ
ncbi:hypothetical protein SHELI_v1c06380 [Spiroplasma helicoides]|uniref:Uncharacterized protein n=1 Tax=Spiroplasma helicoides TaxID=216938 RepID=A0A1B3SKX8_9MOLU|nr:hypothetical protein [Spiroplasma helicoides]AOG60589.1 hypothetical protein SHELI_v1c06380 [Spiroplasma helicoides]